MKNLFVLITLLSVAFTSCKKDDQPEYNPNATGTLAVEFDNIAGDADLAIGSGVYSNASGEQFNVTELKYYVSNFVLTRTDGTTYTVPQQASYFLIDESEEDNQETEMMVPEGEYKSLTFTIGVDSLRTLMDPAFRTGALDTAAEAADMYWDVARGYKSFVMEGISSASPTGLFNFEVGGYGGNTVPMLNNLKIITIDLTARGTAKVKSSKGADVHLMVDILKLFNGSNSFTISSHSSVGFEPFSASLANNFTAMITHDHTH